MRTLVAWVLAGLLGILIAAGLTYAASSLSSQHVGLSSEPLRAGDDLAPAPTGTPSPTPTASPEDADSGEEADDDHSGRGRGRGRGRGGDDD